MVKEHSATPFSDAWWIESPYTSDASLNYRSENQFIRFHKRFDIDELVSGTIHISACEHYILYLNGVKIGRGPAVSYHTYWFYDSYQVDAGLLKEGENTLSVLVYAPGAQVETIQGFDYDETGLIVQADFGKAAINSDESWLSSIAPEYSGASMVSKWGFFKEFYHGEERDGWLEPGYEPGDAWKPAIRKAAATSDEYINRLVPMELPRLKEEEILPERIVDAHDNLGKVRLNEGSLPAAWEPGMAVISSGEYGSTPEVILDFSTIRVGYPEIEISGGPCIYELWYGESLDMLRLDCVNATEDMRWEAYMRRSFRYLMIRMVAQETDVTIKQVAVRQELYDYPGGGIFCSSDPSLDEIMKVSLHTLQVNTSYHFEDCPMREQALWVFDLRVMAQIVYYHHGDSELVRKNLLQIFYLQREDGSIPATGPKDNRCNTIDFCYHLVGTLREYIEYSGDTAILDELEGHLLRLFGFLQNFVTDCGLVHHEGAAGWGVFLDWSSTIQKAGMSVILNALYANYLDDMQILFSRWREGFATDCQRWEAMRRNIRKEARARLFDTDEGLFADSCTEVWRSDQFSFQGNIAALYAGFFCEDEIAGLLEFINHDELSLPFGPSFYHIAFEALGKIGAAGDIMKHIKRFYSGMLERGATTWWEVFDPNSPSWSYPHPFLGNTPTYEMDWIPISSCHGWSGVPAYAVPKHIMGVDLDRLYLDEIHLRRPLAEEIGNVSYRVPVRDGFLHLEASWEGSGTYVMKILEAPEGITIIPHDVEIR